MRLLCTAAGVVAMCAALALVPACDSGDLEEETSGLTGMSGEVADCEFPTVTFLLPDGTRAEVSVNELPVAVMAGADKSGADSVTVVERRGVRFADLLDAAGIAEEDETPVNCIARDGFDPLRTKLEGDVSKLPTFGFLRDHGYVYVGSPGDKDPLYPEMEELSLIVDYDLATDDEVPESLGGKLVGLNMFRWKMVEKVDDDQRGLIEIDPAVL